MRGHGIWEAGRKSSRSTVVGRLAITNITQANVVYKSGIHCHLGSDLLENAESDAIESRVFESAGLVLAQRRTDCESDDYIIRVLLYADRTVLRYSRGLASNAVDSWWRQGGSYSLSLPLAMGFRWVSTDFRRSVILLLLSG